MLRRFILAFILGLILFLGWGKPAYAFVPAPAPIRPPLVNPNITGGTLAPAMPGPLAPAPLPGAGVYPVPFVLPLGEEEIPSNPFICSLQMMAVSYVYRDFAQYRYDQYNFTNFGPTGSHIPVGTVPDNFSPSHYIAAYRKSSMYSSYSEGQIWGFKPGDKYTYEYKDYFYEYTNWQGTQKFYQSSELFRYINGVYVNSITSLFPFELAPVDVPVDANCMPSEEEEPECPTTLDCLFKIFSGKFPFDVFFALPDDRGQNCPTFVFFGKAFQLCWLYQMVSYARYPIVLSLIVKVTLHL